MRGHSTRSYSVRAAARVQAREEPRLLHVRVRAANHYVQEPDEATKH